MTVLGTDGGLLEQPVEQRFVTLAPGQRVELWLDLSARAVGSTLALRSEAFPLADGGLDMGGGMGMMGMERASGALPLGAPINLWMGLFGGTALVLSTHGAEQLIVQRVLACRDIASGRKALVFSAVVIFPLFLVFLLVGV
jgi:hypothetical protein